MIELRLSFLKDLYVLLHILRARLIIENTDLNFCLKIRMRLRAKYHIRICK